MTDHEVESLIRRARKKLGRGKWLGRGVVERRDGRSGIYRGKLNGDVEEIQWTKKR